nr:MAG TPA: hypothetical protein [Caudoviricetes sp.]
MILIWIVMICKHCMISLLVRMQQVIIILLKLYQILKL